MSPRRRAAAATPPAATFRGPPHRLTSLVPLPDGGESLRRPTALLEGAEVSAVAVRPLTHEGPRVGKVTLRLPKSTPPGSYKGSVEVAGTQVPVAVEVEPRPKVEASPSRLSFEAAPGAEVAAELTLLNVGNVPYELPAASAFCVFDGSGVDHAFWVAFTSDPPEGKERIDLLLEDLAGSHGGLVEVRARTENRTIPPGEARQVEVALRFSDRLQPGRSYRGTWGENGLRVRFRVSVPAAKPRQRARVAR